jgi:hypothetical protein
MNCKANFVDDQEMEEITNFFDEVESLKNKILTQLQLKQPDVKIISPNSSYILSECEIINLLLQNVNLVNIISEETIKIYVDSFFKLKEDGYFELTENSLESFLTSIMIFSNNDE